MFRPGFIEARDLNEAYFQLISLCWENGVRYEITEGSNKGGYRLELPVAAGIIHFPHTRPLAPVMPPGVPATTTDEKIQDYFTEYLMNPTLEPNEEYRYATWINGPLFNPYIRLTQEPRAGGKFFGFGCENPHTSQLDWCIRHFKDKGLGNNHCFITVGDPKVNFNYDSPYRNETERKTSPCLRGLDIKVKDNQVLLGIIYRSWDLFAGFPENMGGFTLLNEYIANELGVEPGPLTFFSQGLHCYDYQIGTVMAYLRKDDDVVNFFDDRCGCKTDCIGEIQPNVCTPNCPDFEE